MINRLLIACCAVSYAMLLFWFGGFDFNERGVTAVGAAIVAGFVFGMVMTYPSKNPGDDDEGR